MGRRRSVPRVVRVLGPLVALLLTGVGAPACSSDRVARAPSRRPAPSATTATTAPPSTSAPTSTTAPFNPAYGVDALFLSDHIGVVVVRDERPSPTGISVCDELYVTTDLSTWRDVSPPATTAKFGPCSIEWTDAWFVSPTDGWVVGRVGADVTTVLEHTVDGGRSWEPEPGGAAGSNGGYETIRFSNGDDGIRQQYAIGANAPQEVDHTTDGGRTFTTVSGPNPCGTYLAQQEFATASTGFVAGAGTAATANGPDLALGRLCRSLDGGATWSPVTLTTPPTYAGAISRPQLPTFFDQERGVEAVYYLQPSGASAVAVFTTDDTGATWTLQAVRTVKTADTPGPGTYGPDGLALPAEAAAPTGAVWLIGSSLASASVIPQDPRLIDQSGPLVPSTIQVAANAGGPWATVSPENLPAGTLTCLIAASATTAWAAVTQGSETDPTAEDLLQTTDGGQTWSPVLPRPLLGGVAGGCSSAHTLPFSAA